MSENETASEKHESREFNLAAARLAYSVIQNLLEHARVTGDLVALMAQVLDEETVKALTATPYWTAYLDSRRLMERTSKDIEKFTEIMTKLSEEQGE